VKRAYFLALSATERRIFLISSFRLSERKVSLVI
jgi:hypothetical protein